MCLIHLYLDLNSLGTYPDIIYGHLPLSGAEDLKVKFITYKNKYYVYSLDLPLNVPSRDMDL